MPLDILTVGEALVEVMRTAVGQPLDRPGPFTGPYPSGAPFIFAAQAARLGARVAAIGAVGQDAFGHCLLDQLLADGIDTRGVRVLRTHTTGVAFVAYAPDGSREFVFHFRHAAAGQLSPDLLDPALFEGLGVLHLMGSTLSIHAEALRTGLRALELAQSAGARFSFDPNLRHQLMPVEQAREAFSPFVLAADVILPTAEEAQLLTAQPTLAQAVEVLLSSKPGKIVIITQGRDGCTVYTQQETHRIPGFAVEEVDPTGAGDCFDAGFLVRWLAGDPVADAARFANACGALAVTAQGPMAGARRLDEVRAFIQSQPSTPRH
ncbi:MAG TPA: sugar kinase [Aggregatilineaceae bacterium]|nr:sugar kinase [Aggregatilineaceae bacterium]